VTPHERQKNATPEGEAMRAGKGLVPVGRQERAAHEPLIRFVIFADVPLAGLSLRIRQFVNVVRPVSGWCLAFS